MMRAQFDDFTKMIIARLWRGAKHDNYMVREASFLALKSYAEHNANSVGPLSEASPALYASLLKDPNESSRKVRFDTHDTHAHTHHRTHDTTRNTQGVRGRGVVGTGVEQVKVVEVADAVAAAEHEEAVAHGRRRVAGARPRHRPRRDGFAPRQNRLR